MPSEVTVHRRAVPLLATLVLAVTLAACNGTRQVGDVPSPVDSTIDAPEAPPVDLDVPGATENAPGPTEGDADG